jgi:hypothetical protein
MKIISKEKQSTPKMNKKTTLNYNLNNEKKPIHKSHVNSKSEVADNLNRFNEEDPELILRRINNVNIQTIKTYHMGTSRILDYLFNTKMKKNLRIEN